MEDRKKNEIVTALHAIYKDRKVPLAIIFKDFNFFVGSQDDEISQDVSVVLQSFRPDSRLGKLLRAKLIDRFRYFPGVIEALQSGDSLNINQALKCDWFFADIRDPENFVEDTIPKIPFSTRMKVINRYASHLSNTGAAEIMYLKLKSRYGVRTSIALMPACSEKFVKNELPKIAILLPRGVALSLYDKHPSLIIDYMKRLFSARSPKHNSWNPYKEYQCVFVKLSTDDLDSFLYLFNEYGKYFPSMRLGRRPTKRLIKNNFDMVSVDYAKYSSILNSGTFFERLSSEKMKTLHVCSLLPKEMSSYLSLSRWSDVWNCLDYIKPSFRSDFLVSSFKSKYNRDCTEDDILYKFPMFLVKYLPTEAKTQWVYEKLENIDNAQAQAEHLIFLPVEDSIPRLKKLITSQSDASLRTLIAEKMLETLKLNQFSSAIKDLFEFFVKRFRNESPSFMNAVIAKMMELEDLLLEMEMADWIPIVDFINIIKLNDTSVSSYYLLNILGHQIHACFLKNEDVDHYLTKYLNFAQSFWDKGDVAYNVLDLCKGTPYHRNCLEWFLNMLPKIRWNDDGCKLAFLALLLKRICKFNRFHEKCKINVSQFVINELELLVADENQKDRISHILDCLTKSKDFELRDRLLMLCFPRHAPVTVLCRFLKKNPDMILNNLESVLTKCFQVSNGKGFRTYSLFYKKCRLYESFGITAKIMEICFAIVEQEIQGLEATDDTQSTECDKEDSHVDNVSQLETKPHAIQILALIQEPSQYLALCSEHIPKQERVEDCSETTILEYNIQKAICKSFTGITDPFEVMPTLFKFSGGDFLKLVCGSLAAVSLRTPEHQILPLLEEWLDSPVSLRKHIFRLIYRIAPAEYSKDTFTNIFQVEKNGSLRLVLFLQLRDTFIAEPGEDSYKIIEAIIDYLTEEDGEILEKLFEVEKIDEAFISRYLELVWGHIDSTWANVLPNGKNRIMELFDRRLVGALDNAFADTLLSHEMSTKLPNVPSKFVCHYLLCCPSSQLQSTRLNNVVTAMTPFIKQHWNDRDFSKRGPVFRIRNAVSDFVSSLCRLSKDYEDDPSPSQLLTHLNDKLSSIISTRDFLHDSIVLNCYVVYYNQNRGEAPTFVSNIARVYKECIEKHESQMGYSLISKLINVTDSLCDLVSNMKLACELVKTTDHPYAHILATEICDSKLDSEDLPESVEMMEILSSSKNPHVQASASELFRSLNTLHDVELTL